MNLKVINEKAKALAGRASRADLADLNLQAERGEGELAGLSRFERAQLNQQYEKERQSR